MKKGRKVWTLEQNSILEKLASLTISGREANENNFYKIMELFADNQWLPESTLRSLKEHLKVGRDIQEGKDLKQVLAEKQGENQISRRL